MSAAISRMSGRAHAPLGAAGRARAGGRSAGPACPASNGMTLRFARIAAVLERHLGDVAGEAAAAKVDEDHVVVRAAADDPVAAAASSPARAAAFATIAALRRRGTRASPRSPKQTAFAAIRPKSGAPWVPGKIARSIAFARSAVERGSRRRAARASSCRS